MAKSLYESAKTPLRVLLAAGVAATGIVTADNASRATFACDVAMSDLRGREQRYDIRNVPANDRIGALLDDTSERLGATVWVSYKTLAERVIGIDQHGDYIVSTHQSSQIVTLRCQQKSLTESLKDRATVSFMGGFRFRRSSGDRDEVGSFSSFSGDLAIYRFPRSEGAPLSLAKLK